MVPSPAHRFASAMAVQCPDAKRRANWIAEIYRRASHEMETCRAPGRPVRGPASPLCAPRLRPVQVSGHAASLHDSVAEPIDRFGAKGDPEMRARIPRAESQIR